MANWDQLEGNWKQFKGRVQQKWGKLTDDDPDVVSGKREELAVCDVPQYIVADINKLSTVILAVKRAIKRRNLALDWSSAIAAAYSLGLPQFSHIFNLRS